MQSGGQTKQRHMLKQILQDGLFVLPPWQTIVCQKEKQSSVCDPICACYRWACCGHVLPSRLFYNVFIRFLL